MNKIICLLILVVTISATYRQTISPSGPGIFFKRGGILPPAPSVSTSQKQNNRIPMPSETNQDYGATATGNHTATFTFTFDIDNACSGTPVQFTAGPITGGLPPFTYLWKFGDNTSSTLQNPTHSFVSLGCGTAVLWDTLIVTDANGFSDSVRLPINVRQKPDVQLQNPNNTPSFSNCNNSPTPGNPNFILAVNNISPSTTCITSYSINWGDGGPVQGGLTAASFPLSHTYTSLGVFTLAVTAVGNNGCSNIKTYNVVNQASPAVGISGPGGTAGCAPIGFWFKIKDYQVNSPGTYYLWDFGDGSPRIRWDTPFATDSIFHIFTSTSCGQPGNQFIVKIIAINGCDSTTATYNNIKIFIKPAAYFKAPPAGCVNQPVCFTDSSRSGFYGITCSTNDIRTWDFGDPASGASNTSSAINPCHTYSAPGVYTVSLKLSNTCGDSTYTRQVCITAPSIPSFTTDVSEVCAPGTVSVTNNSQPGTCGPPVYQWSVTYTPAYCGTTPGWSYTGGTNASSFSPSFQFTNPGIYTIRLTISGICPSVIFEKIIKVKKAPVATIQNVPASSCGASVICPSALVQNCGDAALTYLWLLDGQPAGNSQSSNPGCITISAPGSHTISLTVTNECGSITTNASISINNLVNLVVPPSAIFCPDAATGDFIFQSTTPGVQINWTNNNTAIGLPASGTGNISSFITTNTGAVPLMATITVTATANGCNLQSALTITVNSKPAAPIAASPVNYCKDDIATALTATALPGHTLLWYTAATGGIGNTTAPVPSTAAAGTVTYYVGQQNDNTGCEGNRTLISVNVTVIPVIASISGSNPVSCGSASGTITVNGLTPAVSYTVSYIKNGILPAVTVTLTANASGNIIINGLTPGIYSDIQAAQNGCRSALAGPVTLSAPNPPAAPLAASNGPVCEGQPIQLTASSADPGAVFSWTGPGFSSPLASPTINNATAANAGTYTVTATVNNCTSLPVSIIVVVNARPAAPTVAAAFSVCANDTIRLTSSTNFPGPVTYGWTGPNGFISNLPNPVLLNADNTMSGLYQLVITSVTGSCASSPASTNVTVLPLPVISTSSHINPIGCNTNTGTIILNGLNPLSSYTIRYSRNGGAAVTIVLVSNSAGTLLIGSLPAGIYSNVTASLSNCASAPAGPFMLTDTAPFSVEAMSSGPVCAGENISLSATVTSSGTAIVAWTGPNGFTSNSQFPVIANASFANIGVYYAAVTINGCTATDSITVTVSQPPVGGRTNPDATVCQGNNHGDIFLTGQLGSVEKWEASINNGITWAPVQNTGTSLSYNNLTISTLYRAVIRNGVCPPAYSDTTTIRVVKGIDAVRIIQDSVSLCTRDTTLRFDARSVYSGLDPVTYYWSVNGSLVASGNSLSWFFNLPLYDSSETRIKVYAENSIGCRDSSAEARVYMRALPRLGIVKSNDINCVLGIATITLSGGAGYTWQPTAGTQFFASSNSLRVSPQITTTYTINAISPYGCKSGGSVTVVVNKDSTAGKFMVPSAFTPNGDGRNDCIGVKTWGFAGSDGFEFNIYNRWGQLVFHTTNPADCWNGMFEGKHQPPDVYVYWIKAKTICETNAFRKGTIALIR
jgi:large repetitive protein